MFKNILVCLDGSQIAEQVIPGVLTPDIPGFPGVPVHTESMLRQLRKDEAKAKTYLKGIAQMFRDQGIRVKIVTLEGPPGPTIINYADENKIDLIAISALGHSGLRNVLFGSVAEFVLKEAKVPVLLVRPQHP